MAPEVWKGSCGAKADVWSLGCVMFELLTGKKPFECSAGWNADAWLAVHARGPEWALLRGSKEAQEACKQMLTVKERSRPSTKDCLKMSWFKIFASDFTATPEEIKALCQAFLNWRDRNPMQRAICLKMATESCEINKFASAFSAFDADNSGALSQPELIEALKSMKIDEATAKKCAAALDVDGDGSCEYLEFSAACLSSLGEVFDRMLWHEFSALDVQGKGELSTRDLQGFIEKLQTLAPKYSLRLKDLDKDRDGSIDWDEFCAFFGRPGCTYRGEEKFTVTVSADTVAVWGDASGNLPIIVPPPPPDLPPVAATQQATPSLRRSYTKSEDQVVQERSHLKRSGTRSLHVDGNSAAAKNAAAGELKRSGTRSLQVDGSAGVSSASNPKRAPGAKHKQMRRIMTDPVACGEPATSSSSAAAAAKHAGQATSSEKASEFHPAERVAQADSGQKAAAPGKPQRPAPKSGAGQQREQVSGERGGGGDAPKANPRSVNVADAGATRRPHCDSDLFVTNANTPMGRLLSAGGVVPGERFDSAGDDEDIFEDNGPVPSPDAPGRPDKLEAPSSTHRDMYDEDIPASPLFERYRSSRGTPVAGLAIRKHNTCPSDFMSGNHGNHTTTTKVSL
eukprot:gnl/TRDRNA2_/TRDRNA2_89904_c0_seq2.p1 gnl/TRDRNA2_/TRDRNA2_89904_c0~~gnl/TRDRNA2_/TRDRNA2_89904_c0_seq2.p1  ORF type:complete len:709 (-),score=107.43 gnl/TRDRNA2_/TRDRNA2_89904_c0_seq2:101-1975(-)